MSISDYNTFSLSFSILSHRADARSIHYYKTATSIFSEINWEHGRTGLIREAWWAMNILI